MPKKLQYSNEALQKALEAMKAGESGSKASRKYGVPKSTLLDKFSGRQPKEKFTGSPLLLSKSEESRLAQWIVKRAGSGNPVVKSEIQDIVSILVKNKNVPSPFTNNLPGSCTMPKERKKNRLYEQDDMEKALEAFRKGNSLRQSARKFGVPRTTLRDKIIGRSQGSVGHPLALSRKHEDLLVKWVLEMADSGHPITKDQLLDTIQMLCTTMNIKNRFTDGRPGRAWYNAFLKRHPVLMGMTTNIFQTNTKDASPFTIELPILESTSSSPEEDNKVTETSSDRKRSFESFLSTNCSNDDDFHEEKFDPEDPLGNYAGIENLSAQSPQLSESDSFQEIEFIDQVPNESPQTKKDLIEENARLRKENKRLEKEVEFWKNEFSKITDIFHYFTENTKINHNE
ncbi:uncharacterized protein LOC129799015 isoform X1 [Phlebotomus papatasi]|uniref:uncharacterized protein LOC129799015 isoform X1 n=1 Tax=Phlebotomus papatasi TaxID=29031 RepID=UPI0024840299|nr:uncharacterized protein LOC129799015 isoform X1 [Phlebotomus papatasi]